MELHEKLQALRKQKNLTQEELAEQLYVSRTAISKWESGRGYPSIDSLKAISVFFRVSIDDLLSGEEILTIAQEERKQTGTQLRALVFGLLDCCAVLLLVLPLFRQETDGTVHAVGALALHRPWLRAVCLALSLGTVAMGTGTLALQNQSHPLRTRTGAGVSLLLSTLCVLLFLVSLQPYAACLSFVLLGIKVIILLKQH